MATRNELTRPLEALAEELEILYQDDDLVVVNKPSGLLVHRGWARDKIVAMTVVRNRLDQWVYPVHRLDRGTSGALLFALNKAAAGALGQQIREQRIKKRYLALLRGILPEAGVIDHPVPAGESGERVEAVTDFERRYCFERYSLVEARPRSGRLHQIRRHFKHLSHPILGDVRYGDGRQNRSFRERFGLWRLALHAQELCFEHPMRDEAIRVEAPLTADLAEPFQAMQIPQQLLSCHPRQADKNLATSDPLAGADPREGTHR